MDGVQPGDLVGGCYVLTRVIGRGATSTVFEADDLQHARKVTIKVVEDPDAGTSLLTHEARALVQLRHPGLPTFHGVGIHQGWAFLVMERIQGVSLEEHLDQLRGAPLPLVECLAILTPLAEALAALHSAGLAHRDLRPASVMLSGGRVVLLDFGVVLPELSALDTSVYGTASYAAPERITDSIVPGQAHLLDTYAFGTMAFEMLAGHAPFEGATLVQVLEHHLVTPPPDVLAVRPDLPRPLAELVLACMAKDPLDRPPNMRVIAAQLGSLRPRQPKGSGRLVAAEVKRRR